MDKEALVILGGLGDGLCLLDELKKSYSQTVVGFLNDMSLPGTDFYGIPVFGPLDSWVDLPQHYKFVPALHKVKEMPFRVRRILELGIPEERWATVIHPTAIIAQDVLISYGSYIGPYVVIQPGVSLGKFLSLRSGVNIGHDCQVKDFVFIGSNCCICGSCTLEVGVQVAPCSTVSNNVHLGEYSIVSLGSAVLKSIPSYSLVLGNPAKIVKNLNGQDVLIHG